MNYEQIVKSMSTSELKTRINFTGSKLLKEALEAELKGRSTTESEHVEDVIDSTATLVQEEVEKPVTEVSEAPVETPEAVVVEDVVKPKQTRKRAAKKAV